MSPPILVTGATGYIGGRLVPRLLEAGHRVRLLVRDASRLDDSILRSEVEIIEGAIGETAAMAKACDGVEQVYYLVHSMRRQVADFASSDRQLAESFAEVAKAQRVKRIIYLGGLGKADTSLSRHLASRQEVGQALAHTGIPVLEFRAAVIVGSGSASFEMIRHLTERLPIMITPRWVRTRCQPIPVRGVLEFLLAALKKPEVSGVHEIGGPDILTYEEMMRIFAEERGLKRWIIPVPLLTPTVSSWWVHLVTPIPRAIAGPLIKGVGCEVVCANDDANKLFGVQPLHYREAVRLALERIESNQVETAWCSSFSSLSDGIPDDRHFAVSEGLYMERHEQHLAAPPHQVFQAVQRLGGRYGWPAGEALWRARALLDRLTGGVGFRRGRPQRPQLKVGDAVDFWRVEALVPDRLLRLRAEMRMPGRGWLQFEVMPHWGGSRLRLTAFYEPHGFAGFLYWLSTLPLHRFIFPTLIKAIARRTSQIATDGTVMIRKVPRAVG